MLVHATQLTGEALAALDEVHDGSERRISKLNAVLWNLRWELGIATSEAAGGLQPERAE